MSDEDYEEREDEREETDEISKILIVEVIM